ncbi:hypothetical protein N9937_00425 [bacterium]|nr:hypothetical protein [bacterium]
MAVDPSVEYSGNVAAPDAEYPYGKARNITTSGDGLGTPWEQDLVNDIFGFQQSLLSTADITPSNIPDTVLASQYMDALSAISGRTFATKADLIAAKNLKSGTLVMTSGYGAVGDGGAGVYLVQTSGEFGFSPDELGDHTLPLSSGNIAVLQVFGRANIKQYGANGSGAGNQYGSINAAVQANSAIYVPSGYYQCANASVQKTGGISILGDGIGSSVISFGNSALNITLDNDSKKAVEIQDISFYQDNAASGNFLQMDGSAQTDADPATLYVRNVEARGSTVGTSGYLNGINAQNVSHVLVDGFNFIGGKAGANPETYNGNEAMTFLGGDLRDDSNITVVNSTVTLCKWGIRLQNISNARVANNSLRNIENCILPITTVNGSAVPNRKGIVITGNTFAPLLIGISGNSINNCSITGNTFEATDAMAVNACHNIWLTNVTDTIISGNSFISTNTTTNFYGIIISADGASSQDATATGQGVYIYGNSFKALTGNTTGKAIWLQGSSSGVEVGDNALGNFDELVRDQGTGNVTKGYGVIISVSAATDSFSGIAAKIDFDTVESSTIGTWTMWNGTTDVVEINKTGYYNISLGLSVIGTGSTGVVTFSVKDGGTTSIGVDCQAALISGITVDTSTSRTLYLTAGQSLAVYANTNTTGNVRGDGVVSGNVPNTHFQVTWSHS